MAREIRLPQLGQTMEEGTVVSCMVKVGDEVKKGDVIFEIETDKATLEMESTADGFVKHILAEVGQTLPVGAPVLIVGEKDEEVPQSFIDSLQGGVSAVPERAITAMEGAAAATTEPGQPKAPTGGKVKPARAERIVASPRARELAKELGVGLSTVTGTGPAGRITAQDVKEAAGQKAAMPEVPTSEARLGQAIPLNRLQRITAERMLRSKQEIPCFYLSVKADVTELVELRTRLNETSEVKISYNDFIIKAVAMGLERFPIMTGQLAGDTIQLAKSINIGLAIAVPGGLVAPIIKDVNKKDVTAIARDSKALIEKARGDKLAPADLEGGCITVSNLGALGIASFIPIVVPGQCSILGIGQISDTCVPESGGIAVRKLVNMTLSVDHKVANGAYAAQFLGCVKALLQEPSSLV